MGALLSRLSRLGRKPLQSQRKLDQVLDDQPVVAPKHPSTREAIAKLQAESEEQFKDRDRKDGKFLNLLKDFKVDSTDVKMPGAIKEGVFKSLSQTRLRKETLPSTKITKGRITTQKLSELLVRNMRSPSEWTQENIADHYKLDKTDVAALLRFYSDYAVVEKGELPKPLDNVSFIE